MIRHNLVSITAATLPNAILIDLPIPNHVSSADRVHTNFFREAHKII
jgi:hypothetical protein